MVKDVSIYESISQERKKYQESGEVPKWMTTGGYQLLKEKYLNEGETVKDRYRDISNTIANYASELYGKTKQEWSDIFFNMTWKGHLSPSTPVLANTSEKIKKGCSVSCSGGYVEDSVLGFYAARTEAAVLTQEGFGTSAYMGDIRARGSKISRGGKAAGSLPVFKGFVQDMRDVSQGNTRRGAWAGYIEVEHGDFWEVADYVYNNPDDFNIGWILTDSFEKKLDMNDPEAIKRWRRIMKIRAITGKGYHFYVDKVNRQNPQMYKDLNLSVKASNLCSEVVLHSDEDHTYTCVLSSLNLEKWDEYKDDGHTIFNSLVFLDCVAEHFIRQGSKIKGLEKAVRFTEKSRALGLGVLGFHTYLQDRLISIESFEAHTLNLQMFKRIDDETLKASKWMAEIAGEPEWCNGYGVRNTHRLAIAPTMSTATICGGVSQGIEPFVANAFNQNSAAGEISRVNPSLLNVMKERGVYNDKIIKDLIDHKGSVQHVGWLSDEEKLVFRTAFEIDQAALIRLASARQQFIDQGQSLNLFFDADEDEGYISQIHKLAYKDPRIKALYYMRSMAGVQAAKNECVACEG
jgi:ribonucleoside-diphosphate reductase alpha chain